ncbi:DNA-directed RNA polymerase subunit K [Archaeoglobus veneficus]|uniref:DNA-directed RNA polymerase subunit Rpo6 n=1 Tax=Archaeoglobus veneficus (strain DSM 11195 / SNP6) TaxID=693661 RepID=F2KPR6_ARCVS|nr:DNA-directed RNA polymerase subunit K [Archaeoglobus veneficus]AEA47594.1 DNA-directed RNA polymerase subunit K [Archaeoglobus veneficus SNP6]
MITVSKASRKTFPFEYTRFEKARIIGARALQIAMGAPVLIETDRTDPLEIAREEFEKGIIPITVRRRRNSFVWLERNDLF